MAASQDKELALSRVYAEAMLAAAAGREQEFVDGLEALIGLLDREPGFEAVLANPLIDSTGKRELIDKALGGQLSDVLVDGLQVMRRKGRLDLLRELALSVHEIWLARQGKIEVEVASAVPLSPALREEFVRAVGARLGKRPVLVERIDPRLLGGLVVRAGDAKIDSSVATTLKRIEVDLLSRASTELHSGKSYVTNS
jgi:F-type H+-transporting ATPase subunit delta